MTAKIFIINGPNLNQLGKREPGIYGSTTLADIESSCKEYAHSRQMEVITMQSNSEGEMVTAIQDAKDRYQGIIINAAAYTHTSVAILDALKLLDMPIIEVHLSNIYQREIFRHHSYISPVATGVICGFGAKGYVMAIDAMADLLAR